MQNYQSQAKFKLGFTLVELMLVLIIVAILTAIALPSYQNYARRANAAAAQQEMQKLAEQLERHKSRNFSYKGFNAQYLYNSTGTTPFDASTQTLTVPLNATGAAVRYTLTIVDGMTTNPLLSAASATGQSWAIRATSADVQNFSFLMTSSGLRCQNKTSANITYATCGTGGENW
ncbi:MULTISPECIES: type IV pilin protein [Acinetobacter]|uniref:type IV pilin protein n=1 Tax=Acinetobacter TaxID=469 RepID=UPI00051C7B87|nr:MULTISPECIES: type IV pilin protein [Acinetobacter]MCH7316942.1 prepilin-type N-terminal cleavage/methylation domain-containing protein [Acinetobacter higginsii]MCH7379659.1 prepilin-type N-terminal cleavage/methylation domain-containing protein [Acinetobacter higginsii]